MDAARRPIWDIDCRVIDIVFLASFDWQEAANLLVQYGHDDQPCGCLPVEELTYKRLHDLCHADSPISRAVQARLDKLHRDALRHLGHRHPSELIRFCVDGDLGVGAPRLPAVLWALFRDPRPELTDGLRVLLMRLHYAMTRAQLGEQAPSLERPDLIAQRGD